MVDRTQEDLQLKLEEAERQYAEDKANADSSLEFRDRVKAALENYMAAKEVQVRRPFRLTGSVDRVVIEKPIPVPEPPAMPDGRFDQIEWVVKSYGHGVQAAQVVAVLYKRGVFGDKDKDAVAQMVHRNIFSMKKNGRLVEYPDGTKRKNYYGLPSFFNEDGSVKPEHKIPASTPSP